MNTMLIAAVVAITMALLFYTIGVWWERLERELAEAGSGLADKGRLEEQVDLLFERFRQIRPILQEKDRQLQASEDRIAEQERTIRSLRERLGGRG